MMAVWKQSKLGDLIETQKGFAFKSGWYTDVGRPIVKVSNFTDDSVDSSGIVCIPEEIASAYLKYKLKANDVVVQTVGSWPTNPASVVGKCVRVPTAVAGALLNQNAVKLSPTKNIDATFLYYLLRSDDFKSYIISTAQGAASQAAITLEAIRAFEFMIPQLPLQQRIAGILSAYDELIENNQRRIRILEDMARSLYREWFVHFRYPGHESVPLADSSLGQIPQGWEVKNVRHVAGLVSRGPSLAYVDTGGVQVVNQRCIRNDEIEMQAVQYAAPLSKKKSHLYLRPYDVLINSMGVGTLGRVSRNLSIVEPTIIHNCITVVRARAGEPTTVFLYYRLSDCQAHFESLGVGATGQTSLRIETIEDVQFALPPVALLSAFEEVVLPIWAQIGVLKRQIQNLRCTRDLLLPRLLSGQVNLDATETLMEEAIA